MITLNVSKLHKSFKQTDVLTDLSFNWQTGICGIAGSNGAGKSTLIQILLGLIKPSAGSINWTVAGEPISRNDIRKVAGFAAPYMQLYEELTPFENLQFLRNLHSGSDLADPTALLERFKADLFAHSPYGDLSTGQQQRVKLAAALIHNPRIICLDEPGSNLDRDGIELIEDLVKEGRESKKMVIIASNNTTELAMCDDVINL